MRGVEVTLLVVAAALSLSSSRADAQGAVISGDVSGSKALDETNFNFDNSVRTVPCLLIPVAIQHDIHMQMMPVMAHDSAPEQLDAICQYQCAGTWRCIDRGRSQRRAAAGLRPQRRVPWRR